MTARTIRERAWSKLGEGNWGKAMLAFLLFWLAGIAIAQLMQRIGIAVGDIKVSTIGADVAAACAKKGFDASAVNLPQMLADVTTYHPTLRWKLLDSLASILVNGALQAGWALFAVALMRNGARALQVFSGFGSILSCGWLMFLMSLRIVLWSLLLLIPGLVAFYAYRMAFFLRADHPDWSAGQLLAESRRMMKGHKWRLMYLDASFLGWLLLVVFTFGLAIFFVAPYFGVASAAFYEDLLDRS